jgi:hypothetical protein
MNAIPPSTKRERTHLESKDPPSVISDTINTDVFTVSEFMRS